MADHSIIRDGATAGNGVCAAFDHTVLDQSGFYPPDMSALPTSTPNPANMRRKSRRSWFETTPKGCKFEIAVEKPFEQKRPVRKSESMEVLTLSHFSGAPRLDFGTMKIGQEKLCTLLLRNPHDYEQSVKIEKFPEKKHFSVPLKQFVVGAQESYPLEITWSPKEAGGCREMVLMQVDGAYRVQAYVFGTVTAPPPQKRKGKRVGLLASKVSKPFSVIHTTSLANINQQYSPEKKIRKRSTGTSNPRSTDTCTQASKQTGTKSLKPGTQARVMNNQAHAKVAKRDSGAAKGRKSSEGRRRSARLSDKFVIPHCETGIHESENIENIEPVHVSKQAENRTRKLSERKASLPKPNIDENIPKKKMRRSNTYSNVSGLGLVVPIIHGETVKGHKDTSMLIEDCNISGVQVLKDSATNPCNYDLEPSFLLPEGVPSEPKSKMVEVQSEPSFLVEEGLNKSGNIIRNKDDSLEPSFLIEEKNTIRITRSKVTTNNLEPSFLEDLESIAKSSAFTAIKKNEEYHDSLEAGNVSFESEENKENVKETKGRQQTHRRRSGRIDRKNDRQTGVKLLQSAKRNNARNIVVSPDTFVKDVCPQLDNTVERIVADEHKPLNDSVGQSSILEQLKSLKSFVHDKSLEIEKSGHELDNDKDSRNVLERRETFVKSKNTQPFAVPRADVDIRRETFVAEPNKLKLLENKEPSEASPRRTTFTVLKGSKRGTGHTESGLKDKELTLHEEAEDSFEESENGNNDVVKEKNDLIIKESARLYSVDSLEDGCVQKQAAKRFSADSLENDSFEKHTESPDEIFVEGKDDFNRRSTLTVVKSRPSDALLEHAQRSAAAVCLFDAVDAVETITEEVIEKEEVTETTQKSVRNSTFEITSDNTPDKAKDSSFPTTPYHLLPSSSHLDHSRRSTHVVEKPRVLDRDNIDQKELFARQKNVNKEDVDSQEMQEGTQNVNRDEERDVKLNDESLTNVKQDIGKANEVSYKDVESEISKENYEEIANSEGPSYNTRRRKLSARRSVTGLGRESVGKMNTRHSSGKGDIVDTGKEQRLSNENTDSKIVTENRQDEEPVFEESDCKALNAPAQGLFFVPFDAKEEVEAPARQPTKKPDPVNFLKKRSNPVSQADDKRTKRIKSESTDLKRTTAKDIRKESTTFIKQSTAVPARVTRQTAKSVGSIKDVSTRQMVKSKPGAVKGLAQSKLILSKKSKSAIPKHPLPFAARNMFYDERWMEKQERGFVNWLNFILTPPEEHQGSDVKVKVDAGKLTLDVEKGRTKLAPTNEILSFRTYSAHRKLNRLRKSACRLFQSDSVRRVMQKIESEVESKRLLVRKDKMLHADVGAKQKILDMLLSYNPLWLRVGLETIYGEVVPVQCNTDVYGLSRFVVLRLVASPDIAEEYAHPTVPHLYRDGYAEATSQHTLKRFLMLVYFLDQAKQNRLIEHNPCLFCKNSDIKASKDLLLQFSRDFLSGEGDITRHLGYLGYKVTYTQTALDEFDFAVKTLATDLRDGLRLMRVLEIICSKPEFSKSLRVPAISRLQKIHNVELSFNILTQQNIDSGKVTTRDIVDGHREKTLSLLWTIILHYQVSMVINLEQIKEEIGILERSLRLRKQLHKLATLQSGPTSTRRDSEGPDLHSQDERLDLLMKWCRAVCAFYDIKIENFTVSFSDGRALCHILHYYHPGLLPLSQIHQETSMTHLEKMEKNCQQSLNCSLNDSVNSSAAFGDVEDPAVYAQLLGNEKENFKLLSEKVKELGGVPLMLRWSDMSNTIPDEKVVVTYLMYLCARLLDIRHESRAARVIQHAWRAHRLRKMKVEYEAKGAAVVVIQRSVIKFLFRRREARRQLAALCIQRVWRGHQGRKEALRYRKDCELQHQIAAVNLVQSAVRRYLYRRRYLQMKAAVIQVQAYCRGYLLRKKLHTAATHIQRIFRGHMARHQVKQMKLAAVTIQSFVRGFLVRKSLQKQTSAARTIQCQYRAHLEMRKQQAIYSTMRKSCITIQRCWRLYVARQQSQQIAAATLIQSCVRGFICRKRFERIRNSAICIQAMCRGYIQRQRLCRSREAAIKIQRRFRDYLVARQQRLQFLELRNAVVFLQAQRRMVISRRQYVHLTESAVKLQAFARMFTQRQKFTSMRSAAVIIQKYFRAMLLGRAVQKEFLISKGAAITIQAVYRGHSVRQELRKSRSAAVVIQSNFRCYYARKRFLAIKEAVHVCQQRYRAKVLCKQEREHFTRLRNAAITIQKQYRGMQCRAVYRRELENVTKVQAIVRAFLCRKRFLELKQACRVIQERFRAKQLGTECRQQYLIKLGAAITLQAGFRGLICRKRYHETKQKIVLIQAVVRGHLQRSRYQKLKQSTLTIQKKFRETMVARQQRSKFIEMKRSAIMIQANWRMRQDKKRFTEMKKSAVVIQSQIRGFIQRQCFLKQKAAAVIIQRRIRETLVAKQQRSAFVLKKSAAILIQSKWRMVQRRQEYLKMKNAAIVIQSTLRRHLAQKRYNQLKSAVRVIEKYYCAKAQGESCRRHFLICKGATLTIQATFRGHKVRKVLRQQQNAAVKIQASFKGYATRREFKRLKNTVIFCQRRYRAMLLARKIEGHYVEVKKAVITLQSSFRGYVERRRYLRKRESAVRIQSVVKGYMQWKRYQHIREAVQKIQRRVRETLLARQQRQDFLRVKNAAIVIQSAWKMKRENQKFKSAKKAAILIQAHVRRYILQKKYQTIKSAARTIQRHYRAKQLGDSARREFFIAKGAAMTIQAWFRGHQLRQQLKKESRSAIMIQSAYKCYSQRKKFIQLKKAVIACQRHRRALVVGRQERSQYQRTVKATVCLQAAVRAWKCRREYVKFRNSVVKIQALQRMQTDRRQYLKQKSAASKIQQWFRGVCLTNVARRKFLCQRGAAITIQASVKMYLIRRLYLKTIAERRQLAVVKIQSWFRGVRAQKNFQLQRQAAVVLQTRWRAEMKCRKDVMHYHQLRDTVIAIQSMYRGRQARIALRKHKAAVKIQAAYRMTKQRREFTQSRKAAVRVQTAVRCWQAKKLLKSLKEEQQIKREQYLAKVSTAMKANMAAMMIQRCYRNHRMMRIAQEKLHSILVIQGWMRSCLQRLHYLRDRQRVIRLQSCIRTWLARRNHAAIVIQRAARKWLGCAGERKRNKAALKIQAFWKGFHVRKNIKSRRLTMVRKRVQEATASATEDKKLGNRTTSALDFLLKYKQLSQVLNAVQHLEVASRLSWNCCERMVDVNAVSVLYRLMRGCNRSLPHMEIIKLTILILINLAKYEKTRPSVYETEEGIETLVELMQIYREKGEIFSKICMLLGIIALDTPCKTSILEDKKLVDRLRSIQSLTARKHKITETQRVTRARMNASSMNATFAIHSPIKKQKVKPDWSLQTDKMRTIENPLKAINFALGNLGISANSK